MNIERGGIRNIRLGVSIIPEKKQKKLNQRPKKVNKKIAHPSLINFTIKNTNFARGTIFFSRETKKLCSVTFEAAGFMLGEKRIAAESRGRLGFEFGRMAPDELIKQTG